MNFLPNTIAITQKNVFNAINYNCNVYDPNPAIGHIVFIYTGT